MKANNLPTPHSILLRPKSSNALCHDPLGLWKRSSNLSMGAIARYTYKQKRLVKRQTHKHLCIRMSQKARTSRTPRGPNGPTLRKEHAAHRAPPMERLPAPHRRRTDRRKQPSKRSRHNKHGQGALRPTENAPLNSAQPDRNVYWATKVMRCAAVIARCHS